MERIEKARTNVEYVLHCLFVSWDTADKRIREIEDLHRRAKNLSPRLFGPELELLKQRNLELENIADMVKAKQYTQALELLTEITPSYCGPLREAMMIMRRPYRTMFERLNDSQVIRQHYLSIQECLEFIAAYPSRADTLLKGVKE